MIKLSTSFKAQLRVPKMLKNYSCERFLEIDASRLPCFTEDLGMDSLRKHSMTVAMGKDLRSHCLSWNTMEIVSGVLPRLSGRVMAATREILAPSSSLSPINDPIRSSNQIRLSGAMRIGDHSLDGHYMQFMNHLTDITTVSLTLMTLRMSL